ncbi:hypothetical protein KMW28_14070 [Flammeovirga yaeyamensis]|uniref:Uncharacterized protein n=1 Tax=Flammeovirga yaeyamensis TaxID=367791 RepID=A0AAX1MZW7_9BACT|nr:MULTISPECIES: hypothetical protein [Flammeovirga]ANQ47820.1 hypothetical protein MY04_0438 [Flammeovirga sp. MY04]MBB3700288.1 hypothetical protein [Flammeovirga yaeyamensis]NMF37086.1 hypothetical protein [Flammeovirga yaeyamensis]QWG00777.1 hypothetical protein KMW28_14070 [Flammeovirga yaeyamensis]
MEDKDSRTVVDSLLSKINDNIESSKELENSIKKVTRKKELLETKLTALRLLIQRHHAQK